jgi:hypothetical protein
VINQHNQQRLLHHFSKVKKAKDKIIYAKSIIKKMERVLQVEPMEENNNIRPTLPFSLTFRFYGFPEVIHDRA